MRTEQVSLLALAALGLAACASRPPVRAATPDRGCINKREINSIGALEGDEHVFVNVSADRYYLLSVQPGCAALTFASVPLRSSTA